MEPPSCVWSPSYRYVAGGDDGELWVIDASTGKVVMRQKFFKDNWSAIDDIRWKGEHAIVVDIQRNTPLKTAPDGYKTTNYTKTIRVIGN